MVRPTTRGRTGSIPTEPAGPAVEEDLDWNRLVSTASKAIESGVYKGVLFLMLINIFPSVGNGCH